MRTLRCGSGRARAPGRDRSRRVSARRCRGSTTTRTHRSWSPASAATGAAGSGVDNAVDNALGNEVGKALGNAVGKALGKAPGKVIRSDVTQHGATQTAVIQASALRRGRVRATPRRSRTTGVVAAATAAKS